MLYYSFSKLPNSLNGDNMAKKLFWLLFSITTLCYACDKDDTNVAWCNYLKTLNNELDNASSNLTNIYPFDKKRYQFPKEIYEKLTNLSKKLSKEKKIVIRENKITSLFKLYTFIKKDVPYKVFCIEDQKRFVFKKKIGWSNLSEEEKDIIRTVKKELACGWNMTNELTFFKVDNDENQIVMFRDLIMACDLSDPNDPINADTSL
jgi:hypothetical protein